MVDFIRIEGSPAERGFQQGEQLKDKIHNMFDVVFHSKMFSEVTSKLIPLSIIKLAFLIARFLFQFVQPVLPVLCFYYQL